MEYNPEIIDKKWQEVWQKNQTYAVDVDPNKPKYYVLDMFPYPSGAGLHVGHPLGYIASDVFSRYKRLCGFNVLHPMGFDAFGLPAEQYAIETGVHPAKSTHENIERYKGQLRNIGMSYQWNREVCTCDPEYYRWTQWLFIQLFDHYYDTSQDKAVSIDGLKATFEREGNANIQAFTTLETTFSAEEWVNYDAKEKCDVLMNYRLAYRKIGHVNWCEALGTVLANDEIKDGLSERGGHPVVRRPMLQWSLRTTAYADRLLSNLDNLDWPDALITQQKNWIGKSTGASIHFEAINASQTIEVFTTRPDTIFGATFMVLAPEHDLVSELVTSEQQDAINGYLEYVESRSERERMAEANKITGAFTGAYAKHPFSGEELPIWISEYVLKDYGTGAIMAVPSDDDRDNAFAEHFGLKIIPVVDRSNFENAGRHDKVGTLINSDFLNGLSVKDAIAKAIERIETDELGVARTNFRLRDANYSRQRYWGEPFPITYDENDVAHSIPLNELPLRLPDLDDYKPTKEGKSPLARKQDWVNLPNGHTRETDTMPGFAGSSWYFLRYMDPGNDNEIASKEALDYWREVDVYIGGAEHAVGHLLYSRMWHNFLFDLGKVPTTEPFKKLINQGMIQGVSEKAYMLRDRTAEIKYQKDGVWESMHEDDEARIFISADLIEAYPQDFGDPILLPVYIKFVSDYGLSTPSYLDGKGMQQMQNWRPELEGALFVTAGGYYKNGAYLPFANEGDEKFYTQTETEKMSKRYHNVINPDDVIAEYGSDVYRLYTMFLGPIEQSKPWDTKGIEGVSKFIKRFCGLFDDALNTADPNAEELKILHTCIKKVREDMERFSFNTCVSAFMVALNDLKKINSKNQNVLHDLVVLLAPFAPHIAEELWQKLGNTGSVHHQDYPKFEASHLVEDSIEYPLCINGKRRASAQFDTGTSEEELKSAALSNKDVQKWLEDKTVRKVIVVPGRMINIVVS